MIRADLDRGAFPPGMPLAIVELAGRLALSPTPVRESLARLAGEGLVEERRRHGYFAPRRSERELAELYWVQAACLVSAVGGAGLPTLDGPFRAIAPNEPAAAAGSAPRSIDELIAIVVARVDIDVLRDTIMRLNAQLRPYRESEAEIVGELAVDRLREAVSSAQSAKLRSALRGYFGLCIRQAPRIFRAVSKSVENISSID
nr:GntR family transcriptional regulator [Sphingomonas formosensis]